MSEAPESGDADLKFEEILRGYSEKIGGIELSVPGLEGPEGRNRRGRLASEEGQAGLLIDPLQRPLEQAEPGASGKARTALPPEVLRNPPPAGKDGQGPEGLELPVPLQGDARSQARSALASIERPLEVEIQAMEDVPPPALGAPKVFPWRLRPMLLALAALMLGAAAAAVLSSVLRSSIRVFPLPYQDSLGLAVGDKELFTLAPQEGHIMSIQLRGRAHESSWTFPNPFAAGLTIGAGSLWSSDPRRGFIYRHGAGPPFAVGRSYPTENRRPSVLYYSHGSLWAWDARRHMLYRYLVAHALTGVVLLPVNEYRLRGIAPAGFYSPSAVEIWALNSRDNKIYRYRLRGSRAGLESAVDLDPWLARDARVTGFTADRSFFWVAAEHPGKLYRIERRAVEK